MFAPAEIFLPHARDFICRLRAGSYSVSRSLFEFHRIILAWHGFLEKKKRRRDKEGAEGGSDDGKESKRERNTSASCRRRWRDQYTVEISNGIRAIRFSSLPPRVSSLFIHRNLYSAAVNSVGGTQRSAGGAAVTSARSSSRSRNVKVKKNNIFVYEKHIFFLLFPPYIRAREFLMEP